MSWALLAISGRITGSCLASLYQKRLFLAGESSLRIVAFSMTIVAMTVVAVDGFNCLQLGNLSLAFWYYLGLSAFLDTIGNFLLVRSIGEGELSIVGPLNSLKPVVAIGLGMIFFQEFPDIFGVAGVTAIVFGSWWLLSSPSSSFALSHLHLTPAVWVRLASIVFTSVASIFLKQAIEYSEPWSAFQGWAILSSIVAWLCLFWQGESPRLSAKVDFLYLGWSLVLMQGMTIWLFSRMPVGYALALFQLSSMVQVLIGARCFGEPHTRKRLMAAGVMAIGAMVVLGSN